MDFHPTGNALAYTGADNMLYVINSIRKSEVSAVKSGSMFSEVNYFILNSY
jgi:hypothetical protein